MDGPLETFCNSHDCKSEKKIIRTVKDIMMNHNNHSTNIKTFEDLRKELKREGHPLGNVEKSSNSEKMNSYIDEEISKLSKSFELVL